MPPGLANKQVQSQVEWKNCQRLVTKLRSKLVGIIDVKATPDHPQRLVIPMVSPPGLIGHFFVACFDFSVHHPDFFVNISFYDSLQRAQKRIKQASTCASMVKKVKFFFNKYILHEKKYHSLQQSDPDLLRRVQYKDSPMQNNGCDCGIFAVATTLHLAERIPLTLQSFSQTHVTKARSELAKTLCSKTAVMESAIFRDCFPLLRGRSIVDATGVEVINNRAVDGSAKPMESHRRSTRSTNPMLSEENGLSRSSTAITVDNIVDIVSGNAKASDAKGKKRDHQEMSSTTTTSNGKATSGNGKATNKSSYYSCDVSDDKHQMTTDTTLYRILHSAKIDCFKDLDDAFPFIEKYEMMTGNRLRIQQSVLGKYRVYRCCSHIDCPFLVRFSKRHSDGKFVLSRMNANHSTVPRPNKALDGRQLKKRRQGKLGEIVTRVLQTKDGLPVPKDIVKTASNKEYNEDLPYMVAWRAINGNVLRQAKADVMNFQLIIPYLDEMQKCNPLSLVGYTKGTEDCDIIDLYFFPSMANDVLKTVRPVISLDAAHLRSKYKGTLYIASVLSGGNDIYPIGFMIASGNEDRKTWTKMLELLKEACPVICEQGFGSINGEEDVDMHPRSKFLFISDRDKGLKPALREVFPDNIEMSCAKHIEANVTTKFGRPCGKHVMAMAKTYSVRFYNTVLEQMRTTKDGAAKYIEDITSRGILWSNSQWTDENEHLPPRFGIVTSNTAESVNSMFNAARDLPWMDALENIIDVMIRRICACRKKYERSDAFAIVPLARRLVNSRWEASASISVMELEDGSGVYTTSTCDYGGVDDEEEEGETKNEAQKDRLPLQHSSTHIVKLALMWCSCGVWQDTFLPCRHACAVYRKAKSADKNYILANLIDVYYTQGCVQATFKRNIYPVSLDTLAYDGETQPPQGSTRSAGRPRTKRVRRRSVYAAAKDSPISCSKCGKPGHNKRTCSERTRDNTQDSSTRDEQSTAGITESVL